MRLRLPNRQQHQNTTDPGMGVVRHADAGYESAIKVAKEKGIKIPMITLIADSYPASACLTTPIPGSVVNTRPNLLSARSDQIPMITGKGDK
jgi:hypothetical protein